MGARAPFNAANLFLFLMLPGGIRTGPRASSMRPASHANLHLINTRGVFAARAACIPICAFCIWRFLRSTATSVFQLVFTDGALFFHGGHAAQTSSFVRRLQAVFTRLGLPRAGDTRKNRSGFAGFEMLPRAVSTRTSCYEGRSEKSACASALSPRPQPGQEQPCRALQRHGRAFQRHALGV